MPRTIGSAIQALNDAARIIDVPASELRYISTGSSLLNLAISGSTDGGWPMGKLANLVGDSSAGKTFLALTMLAEAARVGNHRLIYDDVENACEFDIQKLFGKRMAERMESPNKDDEGEPLPSRTIEQFCANVLAALKDGHPFIYVLDSFDALTSEQEEEKTASMAEAALGGKQSKGTYGMEKAKLASVFLRQITAGLKGSNSFVLVLSQTRDNLDPMSFQKKTRSGGRALKFYSSHEMWLAVKERYRKAGLVYGIKVTAQVKKNKVTGKERTVDIDLLYDYGVDDIGSMIDWLVEQKWWVKVGQRIRFKNGGEGVSRDKLIRKAEAEKVWFTWLREQVLKAWNAREASIAVDRKPKYE